MSDLAKILAKNQKEMLRLIAPLNKKQPVRLNDQDSDLRSQDINACENNKDD